MRRKEPRKLGHDELAEVVRKAPLVSVDLVVKNSRGEILVGLRKNEPARGLWFVPGGRILKDERIAAAFERIAHDELGIDLTFEDATFRGAFEHFYPTNFTEKETFSTHYVVLAYEIEIGEDPLNLPQDQHSEYKWLSRQSLDREPNVHPYTKAYFDCSQ
ncbi:MAG TPA: GDP-mannose mannosyl hydrolase [Sedimentisphaerales bacterium]|nr:GDP-mannose mannosyl hydrolase [Sedimentisphaerales bacterium]